MAVGHDGFAIVAAAHRGGEHANLFDDTGCSACFGEIADLKGPEQDQGKRVLTPFWNQRASASVPCMVISTRRFCARPSLVSLPATGLLSPMPSVAIVEAGILWSSR